MKKHFDRENFRLQVETNFEISRQKKKKIIHANEFKTLEFEIFDKIRQKLIF